MALSQDRPKTPAALTKFTFNKPITSLSSPLDQLDSGQIQPEDRPSPIWSMRSTFNGAWRRYFLMVKNQFINNVSTVHTTTSHSPERLTGSNQVYKVFFH